MTHTANTAPSGTLPEHPVFDASVLGAMFGSESALIASVLQTFASSTRDSLAALEQAAAGPDLGVVQSLAHRITGASRLSGAMALGEAAYRVELAAKQGDAPAVQRGMPALDAQWQLFEAVLRTLATPAS